MSINPIDAIRLLTAWGSERAKKRATQRAVEVAKQARDLAMEDVRRGALTMEEALLFSDAWVTAGNANLVQYDKVEGLYSEVCALADQIVERV